MLTTDSVFRRLIAKLGIDCLCEIGAMDGSDALTTRAVAPEIPIYSFEANPHNYDRMLNDPALSEARIKVLPYAVTNQAGTASFHIADVDYASETANRGESSLRAGYSSTKEIIDVETIRIDDFLLGLSPTPANAALWIDAEGANFEVVEGIEKARDQISLLHIEADQVAYWEGEKLASEIISLIDELKYRIVYQSYADDGPGADTSESARLPGVFDDRVYPHASGNIVCVREDLFSSRSVLPTRLELFMRRMVRPVRQRLSHR